MKVQFRNQPEKIEPQIEEIERGQAIVKSSIKVIPFYFTWFILLMISLSEERKAAKTFTFFLIGGMVYFEITAVTKTMFEEYHPIQTIVNLFQTSTVYELLQAFH